MSIDSVRVGHEVLFVRDPLLYGRMLVVEVERNGKSVKWVACLVNPDAWHRRTERFYPGVDELEVCADE